MRALALLVASMLLPSVGGADVSADLRHIITGSSIPDEGYCDQPYVVITDEGHWLCTMTTGSGHEGQREQHVISTISEDEGQTWSDPVDIEPPGPPEASWVMPLKVPSGRVYAFYTYNTPNIAEWNGQRIRADTIGDIAFKYSDDGGLTWSDERYRIPLRPMDIDGENFFGGEIDICWGVGKPIVAGDVVYWGASKVGHPGVAAGPTEGIFFMSRNILTESDPAKIRFDVLPDGNRGLVAPAGNIAEEQNLVQLSTGDLYCVYRTVDGYLAHATSADGGHAWSDTASARYSPDGRRIKNPRGPSFIRKFSNGKYLLLYYNHSGRDFNGRNPYWLSGGVERDGVIHWSEPEICLYDDNPATRMGYPDYIEHEGRYWLTETNKEEARVHPLDVEMLEGLWRQHKADSVAKDGLVLNLKNPSGEIDIPELPNLADRGGFTLDFWLKLDDLTPGQTLLDTRDDSGKGIALTTSEDATVRLELSDGTVSDAWDTDAGLLSAGAKHHIAAIVDGGPKLITFIVDGTLCDGGEARQHGWHRFPFELADVSAGSADVAPAIRRLRVYNRYLRTSEAIGNWRAGK